MDETKIKFKRRLVSLVLAFALAVSCFGFSNETAVAANEQVVSSKTLTYESIPSFVGKASTPINGNVPFFTTKEKKNTKSFESYSRLDNLKRCGVAYANLSKELMPTEKRGAIGKVKPTGWHTYKFADIIQDRYLYNRCHLIAFCLAGENANKKNLITGTRYMNVDGMLPYVEDHGRGISFNVFCHNVQPNIDIDYQTGAAKVAETPAPQPEATVQESVQATADYVLNTNTKKIHLPGCRSVSTIKPENRQDVNCSISDLEAQGYTRCGNCHP